MEKIDSLNQVSEFHKAFEMPILPNGPQIPSKQRCELRILLLEEELKELSDAIEENNLIEISDAFCDLEYVLMGAILEFGMGDKFVEMFNEVHRSNMSKACNSIEEAIETIEYYKISKDTDGYYKKIGDKWIVYRISDNKVLKSINYSPANLKDIIK